MDVLGAGRNRMKVLGMQMELASLWLRGRNLSQLLGWAGQSSLINAFARTDMELGNQRLAVIPQRASRAGGSPAMRSRFRTGEQESGTQRCHLQY